VSGSKGFLMDLERTRARVIGKWKPEESPWLRQAEQENLLHSLRTLHLGDARRLLSRAASVDVFGRTVRRIARQLDARQVERQLEKERAIKQELARSYDVAGKQERSLRRRQERMREHFRGSMVGDEREHDREVRRMFREGLKRWKEQGAEVGHHRDELQIRREVGRELALLRSRRRVETGNRDYKLSTAELEMVARAHDVPFVNGHMVWPDLEAEVKLDGKTYVVSYDAVTDSYSSREISRKVAAGFVVSMARTRSGRSGRRALPDRRRI
jgi:hypothetical protein